jgi:hypothetical protein
MIRKFLIKEECVMKKLIFFFILLGVSTSVLYIQADIHALTQKFNKIKEKVLSNKPLDNTERLDLVTLMYEISLTANPSKEELSTSSQVKEVIQKSIKNNLATKNEFIADIAHVDKGNHLKELLAAIK